ncbi:amidohydrolase family protein [Aliikangiella marina]|uniref:Amidohydrolase family protein n=1 Tax=Aliikangiella marina TaxID=1712262 RepID=A0A545T6B5_9GAMM|nr:amidohydrolase family protein [Aliikangiella marina]TQV72764.1 amidohydrolase family protein [Aliikangiella marina]
MLIFRQPLYRRLTLIAVVGVILCLSIKLITAKTTFAAKGFTSVSNLQSAVRLKSTEIAKSVPRVIIKNVTLVSAHLAKPLAHQWVKLENGRISQISDTPIHDKDSLVVDGSGQYLTPGLMDSHVHIGGAPGLGYGDYGLAKKYPELVKEFSVQQPRSFLYWGVTEILEPIGGGEGQAFFESQPLHPDVMHCGAAPINGGYPMLFMPKDKQLENFPTFIHQARNDQDQRYQDRIHQHKHTSVSRPYDPYLHTPEKIVEKIASQGASCIKLFIEDGFGGASHWPNISKENILRIKKAADQYGLKVLAHANAIDMQQIAVETQVDIIAHGLWNWLGYASHEDVHPEIAKHLDMLIEKKIAMQPTMRVIPGLKEMFQEETINNPEFNKVTPQSLLDWYQTDEAQWFPDEVRHENGQSKSNQSMIQDFAWIEQRGKRVINYLAQKDFPFLLGSDYPSSPTYANQPGYTTYQEILAMESAGVSLKQIFAAATINNAKAFNIDHAYGTVEVGKKANLLLLERNPWETSEAYNSIKKVILHGRVIDRELLAADSRSH